MKERPIIFNDAMVRAILDGRKTQTRRVMKRQPYISRSIPPQFSDVEPGDVFVCPDIAPTTDRRGCVLAECEKSGIYHCMGQREFAAKHSPYGQPGDRLWVRECLYINDYRGLKVPKDEQGECEIFYRASGLPDLEGEESLIKWTPSIHMPRWASRITLEITGVRVERLQDISEADAKAEGADSATPVDDGYVSDELGTHATGFEALWQSIYGAESWQSNPWVWCVEFKKVTL